MRWQPPDFGTVATIQFKSIAEEISSIVPIGKSILKTACLQSMAWQEQLRTQTRTVKILSGDMANWRRTEVKFHSKRHWAATGAGARSV